MSARHGTTNLGSILGEAFWGHHDVEVLRQYIIVHLLQKVCAFFDHTPQAFFEQYWQLVKIGVLAADTLVGAEKWWRLSLFPPGVGQTAPPKPMVRIPSTQQVVPLRSIATSPYCPHADETLRAPSDSVIFPALLQGISRFERDFIKKGLLGKGSFGEVWHCKHRLDGNEYAVKVVKFQCRGMGIPGSSDRQLEERVLREVQTWARLSHKNITGYNNAWIEADWSSSHWITDAVKTLPVEGEFGSDPSTSLPRSPSKPSMFAAHDNTSSDTLSLASGRSDGSTTVVFDKGAVEVPNALEDSQLVPKNNKNTIVSEEIGATSLMNFMHMLSQRLSYSVTLYIQSELCPKGTLEDWLHRRNSRIDECWAAGDMWWIEEAVQIFFQCIKALHHMHTKTCVHRDVKPSNVFFAEDGTLRLGDFGLAKELQHPLFEEASLFELQVHLTDPGSSGHVGTPSYASPEQRQGRPYGPSTDLYSMGLVLVELFHPMRTQMEKAQVFNDIRKNSSVPESLVAAFPNVACLVLRMAHEEPLHRPTADEVLSSASEVILEIQRLYGDELLPDTCLPYSLSPFLEPAPRSSPKSLPGWSSPKSLPGSPTHVPELELPRSMSSPSTQPHADPQVKESPSSLKQSSGMHSELKISPVSLPSTPTAPLPSTPPLTMKCKESTSNTVASCSEFEQEREEALRLLDVATMPHLRKHIYEFVEDINQHKREDVAVVK
jgi:serine/threonine protein kinase